MGHREAEQNGSATNRQARWGRMIPRGIPESTLLIRLGHGEEPGVTRVGVGCEQDRLWGGQGLGGGYRLLPGNFGGFGVWGCWIYTAPWGLVCFGAGWAKARSKYGFESAMSRLWYG